MRAWSIRPCHAHITPVSPPVSRPRRTARQPADKRRRNGCLDVRPRPFWSLTPTPRRASAASPAGPGSSTRTRPALAERLPRADVLLVWDFTSHAVRDGVAGRGPAAALGAHGERGRGPSDVPRTRRLRHGGDQRPRGLRPADRRVRRRAGPGDGQGPAPDAGAAAGADVAAPRVAAGAGHRARAWSGPGPSGGRSRAPSRRSASPPPSSAALAHRDPRPRGPGPADGPRRLGDRGGPAHGRDARHVRRPPVRDDAALRPVHQHRPRASWSSRTRWPRRCPSGGSRVPPWTSSTPNPCRPTARCGRSRA